MAANLPDTPFWALLQLDLHRRWPRWMLRRAALILMAILAVQAVAYWLASAYLASPRTTMGSPVWMYALYAGSLLGLLPQTPVLFLGEPDIAPHVAFWAATAVSAASIQFLMPAYAGLSIAHDRQTQHIEDLALAGFTGRNILLCKGLAALSPFVVLAAASTALLAGGCLWMPAMGDGVLAQMAIFTPVSFLISAGTMVSLSTLCRGTTSAIVLCYALQFVVEPLVSAGAMLLMVVGRSWSTSFQYTGLAVRLVLLLILLPPALRSLRYPQR